MKIAYVALTRGKLSGGSRKHLGRMVPLLREHGDVERVDVFVHPNVVADGGQTWPERDELVGFRELRRSLAALRPDVLFIPTARLLQVPGIPVVTMVRNMEPLEVPFGGNTLGEGLKNVARAMTARSASRRSDRVIAVSQHVRKFLVDRWSIPEDRIGTVYHGIDLPGQEPLNAPSQAASVEGSRFLFTAGSIRPARGLEDLVEALPHIPADVRVVVAGSVDAGAEPYRARLDRLAEERGVTGRLLWAGQFGATAMSWCFRNATRFVMTSRAEACPNTVLEAMAHGAVSISTDHAPMPEFFGDAAIYYRERDSADLARRINESLAMTDDEAMRLRERAIARATEFTWEKTARETVDQLRRAIEGR
jgi:glycosyltransferase involved in cell wall biosynthesis